MNSEKAGILRCRPFCPHGEPHSNRSYQPACKPGSVWSPKAPRRPFVWGGHCWTPRATNPDGGPGSGLGAGVAAAPGHPYLVLLPVGFTVPLPLPVARCALTAPFHPCRPRTEIRGLAVCSLLHCPWGHPRRPLAATVLPWSPDFPPPSAGREPRFRQRPSSRLVGALRGLDAATSRLSRWQRRGP